MDHHSDVVIIGSGPGGLGTAALLAAEGRSVTVLEYHDIAGGNCTVFRRKGGQYEFDIGVHYVGECEPGGAFANMLHLLGLEHRIKFLELDRDGFDELILESGMLCVPADWDLYEQRLAERYPDQAEGFAEYFAITKAVAAGARGGDLGVLMEWGLRTLRELFDHCGITGEAEIAASHWGGLYGSGPANTSVAVHAFLVGHYMGGAYYPEGGGQAIAARFVELIEALGGRIEVKQRVTKILIENGAAVGVETANGDRHFAPIVVSNGDYKRTMLELLPADVVDDEIRETVEAAPMTLPMYVVYVAVEGDIEIEGSRNIFTFGPQMPDDYYADVAAGHVPDRPFAYVSSASHKDPDNKHIAPVGQTNFQIMTMSPPPGPGWGPSGDVGAGATYRRDEQYRARKDTLTDQLIDLAEEAVGPFRDRIVHVEAATPLSHQRYTLSSDGTSYGLLHSPQQTGPFRPSYASSVPGLFFVGQSTSGGHGIIGALLGALGAAKAVTGRDHRKLASEGERLVPLDLLGPDPDDWDPVLVSRGKAMRERRAHRAGG